MAILAVCLVALVAPTAVFATDEIAELEGDLTCTVCHDKPGSKLYTDQGKYYELMGTLDGFDAVIAVFQKCTTCHVRKPGSERLTPEGRRFSRVVSSMSDLAEWVQSSHPPVRAEEVEQATDQDKEGTPDD